MSTGISITESQISDLQGYSLPGDNVSSFANDAGYLTAESDPVFTAWDMSTGISITESQISDLQAYLTAETDPNALLITNDLSDLNNVATARGNLGLSTSDDVAFNSLGLSDVLSLIPQGSAPAGADGDMYFDSSGVYCGYGNGGWNIIFDTTGGTGNCS